MNSNDNDLLLGAFLMYFGMVLFIYFGTDVLFGISIFSIIFLLVGFIGMYIGILKLIRLFKKVIKS